MNEHVLKAFGFDPNAHESTCLTPEQSFARIISVHKTVIIVTNGIETQKATLSGRLTHLATSPLDWPVVGDFVVIERKDGLTIITRILKRKTLLSRKTAGEESDSQGIASNIDVIFIVIDVTRVKNPYLIERYLSIAFITNALPVIIVSKSDLTGDKDAIISHIQMINKEIGFCFTSELAPPYYEDIHQLLTPGKTYVFIGPSGSGKSTMVNHLLGKAIQSTAAVSKGGEGRHTTTSSKLMVTDNKAIIIDTPGMREVRLDHADLDETFQDIQELSKACRFRDCTHHHEPGCAVKKAIDDQLLSSERLRRYHKLERELINQMKRAKQKERILNRKKK